MIYLGIDPGTSGALAVICDRQIYFHDTPTVQVKSGKSMKNQMDPHACSLLLRRYVAPSAINPDEDVLVTIERVAPMPSFKVQRTGEEPREQSMGVTSAFSFGMGFGIWIGICAGLGMPYQLVSPVTWKKRLLFDMGKEKDASRVKAMQLYPHIADQLSRKKDHARGDALLLARFGQMSQGVAIPEEKPATLFT